MVKRTSRIPPGHLLAPLLVVLAGSIVLSLHAQPRQYRFTRVTVDDGLSDNVVQCITEDTAGFLWFGTRDGLNRYDGRSVRVYRGRGPDSTWLWRSEITSLACDRQGRLWIAGGILLRYDPVTDGFVQYPIDTAGIRGPRHFVNQFAYDSAGILWLTGNGKLTKFDLRTGRFTEVEIPRPGNFMHMYVDREHAVWLSTYSKGVVRVDPVTLRPLHLTQNVPSPGIPVKWEVHGVFDDSRGTSWLLTSRAPYIYDWRRRTASCPIDTSGGSLGAYCMTEDRNGALWIGTWNAGVLVRRPDGVRWDTLRHATGDPVSIAGNNVLCAYTDRIGNVWLGTDKGVSMFPRYSKPFTVLQYTTGNPASLPDGQISSIMEDRDERLWVAVFARGVSRLDRRSLTFRNYPIPNPYVRLLYQYPNGDIVAHSFIPRRYNPGTDRFDPYPGAETLAAGPDEPFSFPPYSTVVDRRRTRWYCFFTGIVRITSDGQRHVYRSVGDHGLGGRNVARMVEDRNGTMWISSLGQGWLQRYDEPHDRFIPTSVSRAVYDMYEDSDGGFWLGTNAGLLEYHRGRDSVTGGFARAHGLGGKRVYGILEDGQKRLWMSTDGGIARLDLRDRTIRHYGPDDGIPAPSIQEISNLPNGQHLRTRRGEMVFGLGSSGMVLFRPEEIGENPVIPPVYITGVSIGGTRVNDPDSAVHASGLMVNGAPVLPLPRSVTGMNVVYAETLRLRHDQNDFSLEFAALDYTAPATNRYRYRLEGFEDAWTDAGTRTAAFFTNIDPGEYRFHVIGSNNDGLWNEQGASVLIIVQPPWWRTPWAYAGYAIALLTVLLTVRRFELDRQRHRHAAEMEHVEAEKLKEVDRIKTRFFANISHEFRTPLTLIEGPLSQLHDGLYPGDVRDAYAMMLRNTRRLGRLVNQLLDLASIESNAMTLRVRSGDIAETVRSCVAAFESSAARSSVALDLVTDAGPVLCWFDRDAVEKVLTNLLSNAVKFTPAGGRITVSLAVAAPPSSVVLTVTDTGIGIPPDEQGRIFDRFYQVDMAQTRAYEGSGIGLSLVKELVEAHHGSIEVSSVPGSGTTFTVRLPADRGAFADREIDTGPEPPPAAPAAEVPDTAANAASGTGGLPTLLVIEDNADMRRFIRTMAERAFSVTEAVNGADGLRAALDSQPDIIISDVMMPVMDGFEVCRRLKSDLRTSHIPVVLLTAKAGQGHMMEGLETGADEYLVKPFDPGELMLRLQNMLDQRRRLREAIQRELTVLPPASGLRSADERFLSRVFAVIEQRYGDPAFDMQSLAEEVALSRMQLHRKVKSLTGYAPGELLRHFRLQRAAEMLSQRTGTVTEIAYSVGYNNLSHFAAQFRDTYGKNPSEFAA